MKDINKYATYCKLTCVGGSEEGTCPCQNPTWCELQDEANFPAARKEAIKEMIRIIKE